MSVNMNVYLVFCELLALSTCQLQAILLCSCTKSSCVTISILLPLELYSDAIFSGDTHFSV